MKLITELNQDIQFITEATDPNAPKSYFIEGIIMQGDIKNRNGRVYPKNILMREMNRYKESYVDKRRAYGELNHPETPSINLDRVSHMFVDLHEEGSDVVGKAKIMDTPMGKIVKNFIDENALLGISSRGLGSLKTNKKGIMEVQDDFMLATAGDIVSDPSAPNAFINGIMENTEYFYDIASGNWVAQKTLDESVKEIDDNYSKMTSEDKANILENFIKSLKR